MHDLPVRRALLSVSDKTGIVDFAQTLHANGVALLSSGGTARVLRDAGLPVTEVSSLTGFPEMMGGRVKTLHPRIHGGILGRRDVHAEEAAAHGIDWIDLVVVNLYPFEEALRNPQTAFGEAIEQIDIGGPAMIRSAAKNFVWVGVVCSPEDYAEVAGQITTQGGLNVEYRRVLAARAFAHTARYDRHISEWLEAADYPVFSQQVYAPPKALRYGENPDQRAWFCPLNEGGGLLSASLLQGKELSWNNLVDADAALTAVQAFGAPACIIVKHATPCGIAIGDTPAEAFARALACDSMSAFGGVIALNGPCDTDVATQVVSHFFEVLITTSVSDGAREILAGRPNLRVLCLADMHMPDRMFRSISGGMLIQETQRVNVDLAAMRVVTERTPNPTEYLALDFAWRAVQGVKSNAIVVATAQEAVGIGGGMVSRIDAVEWAISKARGKSGEQVLASDAFFPFRDSIDSIAGSGIRAIIQPGGSIRDAEVIAACNENGLAMIFTGMRCFRH